MIAVTIDDQSPVPPFEQLRVQLSALILNGTVAAHSKLPTVRQLAGDLGLAKNTVSRAYAALERDGLVTGDRRLGTTVIERQPPSGDDRNRMVLTATRRYLAELAQLGATRADAITTIRQLIADA
jgi:GntR family transcriptional regulator